MRSAIKKWTIIISACCWTALLTGCASLATRFAEAIYPSLDEPWTVENAPTATTFPASSDIRAVLGGRGEGLGCSIPNVFESLFFDRAGGDASVSLHFRQACVFHDFCYRHGHATYGYTKDDCDVIFQQHAFRTCRQLSARDAPQEACRLRARVALLGLFFAGGKHFRHGHQSTFFEFDPMPERATGYFGARGARQPPAPAADGKSADGAIWTFQLRKGWTVMRRFDGRSWSDNEATPFLRGKVPAPPFVVRDRETDRFLWVARPGLDNSGVFAFAVDAVDPKTLARTLPERMATSGTPNPRCKYPAAKNPADAGAHGSGADRLRPGAAYSEIEFDCSTSITKPLSFDCGARGLKPLIATFGHYDWTKQFPSPDENAVQSHCRADAELALASSPTSRKRHGYRFTQNEFLLGRFGPRAGWGLLAFGRGHHGDAGESELARTARGENYETEAMAVFRPFSGDAWPEPRRQLKLLQAEEPLAPFRADADDDGGDRLIALVNPCTKGDGCKVTVREWEPRKNWAPDSTFLPVHVDWLRQPSQVLASRNAGGGDRLFLSRAVSERAEETLDRPDFVPDLVRLEYLVFRRGRNGWHKHGGACTQVDLAKQIVDRQGPGIIDYYLLNNQRSWMLESKDAKSAPPINGTLAELCARAKVTTLQEDIKRGQMASGPKAPGELNWYGINACVALRRELAARWHRSQVIPGYFFTARETTSQRDGAERMPDVAFVFNGHPKHSVLLHAGTPIYGNNWATNCEKRQITQPGEFK